MKRQRKAEAAAASKKKSKVVVEKIEEEGREVEVAAAVENVVVGGGGWEEWCPPPPWLSGEADEQMSWGCAWSPFWDVDFVDKAYNSLFSDVAWDDDIWNLKNNEVPK